MSASSQPEAISSVGKQPSLLKAAGVIALVTIISKMLGAVRDWQIMTVYGASLPSDAYFAAAQLPSFAIVLLGGLGGPFHTTTVAVFSKLIDGHHPPSKKAQQLANSFITLTGVLFTLLSILVFCFAKPIMGVILQQSSPALIDNASLQLQIMAPTILLGGMIGIFYGLLNLYHVFIWPSLSPAALSLVMSAALLLNPNEPSGHLLAWSTLVGTVAQFAIQLPDFFKQKFTFRPQFDWKAPEIRQLGEMLFPAVIGTTIGQLTTYVDMFFTATLPIGGWTAVVLGNRLIQLPIGVLQTALLVPIFPRFSRYVTEEDWGALKSNFKSGVIALWFISIPILVCMLLFTKRIVQLIFEHGQFDAGDTEMVTEVLLYLAFSMLPYFARDSITRVFYAFQDSKTPLIVGLTAIVIKAFLDWLFVIQLPFGVAGIAFSTTLITFLNMGFLATLATRRGLDLGFKEMLNPFGKLLLAGGVMYVTLELLEAVLQVHLALPQSGIVNLLYILLLSMLGCGVYAGLTIFLRIPESAYLLERIRQRLAR